MSLLLARLTSQLLPSATKYEALQSLKLGVGRQARVVQLGEARPDGAVSCMAFSLQARTARLLNMLHLEPELLTRCAVYAIAIYSTDCLVMQPGLACIPVRLFHLQCTRPCILPCQLNHSQPLLYGQRPAEAVHATLHAPVPTAHTTPHTTPLNHCIPVFLETAVPHVHVAVPERNILGAWRAGQHPVGGTCKW